MTWHDLHPNHVCCSLETTSLPSLNPFCPLLGARLAHVAWIAAHVGPISRQLRVGYAPLRKRVEAAQDAMLQASAVEPSFVELSAAQLLGGKPTGAVVELTADDGKRMTVRLDSAEWLDVPRLVTAFLEPKP